MIELSLIEITVSILLGIVAGGLFFGGLWFTVNRLTTFKYPGLLLMSSSLLRIVMISFLSLWLVNSIHGQALLFSLIGFIWARMLIIRLRGIE